MSKFKSQNLSSLKVTLERDVRIGGMNDKLTDSTIAIYVRQLTKIYKSGLDEYQWTPQEFLDRIQVPRLYDNAEFQQIFKVRKSDIIALLFKIYTSKESLIMTLNALCKLTKARYKPAFEYYNTVRKELTRQNKAEKLDNELTPEEQAKYISYDELISIPLKVKNAVVTKYGKLYLTRDELAKFKKSDRANYLRSVFDYLTLYLNVHHPIRLVWPTVNIIKQGNYLEGSKLHVNEFKNVKPMGPQVLELDKPTMDVINGHLNFLRSSLNEQPTKLLYRLYNGQPAPYDYSSNGTGGFSQIISKLFQKYNGKPTNMNTIRHIVESHIIQSPEYAIMTNREKQNLHTRLLHSAQAANISYNKIVRSKEPEAEVSFEPEVIETTPVTRKQSRVYRGEFRLPDSNRELQIDIFEK